MTKCISCSSDRVRTYSYPEGNILACGKCRVQWSQRKPDFIHSAGSHRCSHYMNPDSLKDPSRYRPYVQFLAFVDRQIGKKEEIVNLLDVGTGNGIFLRECLRKGFNAIGVDADANLRRIVPQEVVDRIIFKPITGIDRFDCLFDIISFWDSFEHLPNAFDVLETLKKYLRPRGFIYLRVNNNQEIFNYIPGMLLRILPPIGRMVFKRCFGFPGHFWNFSETGMVELLKKHGWKVIRFSTEETPASRLTSNRIKESVIHLGYAVNRVLKTGKIANYYISLNHADSL